MNIPTEYLITDPSKLVKGQKLWSVNFGEVEFACIDESRISVLVCNVRIGYFYDSKVNGKRKVTDYYPSLFLKNPFESQERVILVMDYINKKWVERVLIKFTDNLAVCWDGAKTISEAKNKLSVSYWATWKELEPQEEIPEYTMEEIAVKLGHDFKIKQ
jgi:hypothetical protein